MKKFVLFTMNDKLHEKICFIKRIFSFFIRVPRKDCVVFSWECVYFFFVLRVVGESLPVGFVWRSPLHFVVSSQSSPLKIAGSGILFSLRIFTALGIVFLPLFGKVTLFVLPATAI